jgi:hypothetical protein
MTTKFTEGSEEHIELQGILDSITLASYMVSKNRPRAKDLKRDDSGRIIVNVTKPHILEDMDYFRKAAISFEKNGYYTDAYPSKDINSPYRKFWDEEKRRCLEGYVRKSDGEWITGYHYYYLNYSPILKSVITGKRNKDGSVKASRVSGFPNMFDGDYMYFHYVDQAENEGNYCSVLKTRGRGYSFKAASMLIRNYQLVGREASYAFASDTEYLTTDGVLNKAWSYLNFANAHIGFAKKLRVKDTIMEKTAGYKMPGDPSERGFLSSVVGVTLKNAPGKARGKRGKIILWEEAGIFPNILTSWRIAQKSLEDGNRVFGIMIAFGTGGEKGANFEGLEALFYKATAYRVKAIPNVFDRNVIDQSCGFFHPEYLNRADCYDKDGNSNVVKALEEVIERRLKIKYAGTSSEDAAQSKAEEPLTPQEAVMRTHGSEFPVEELKNRLAEIAPIEHTFTSGHLVGSLNWVNYNEVEFKPSFNSTPIREWPVKRSDTEGAVEIVNLPKKIDGRPIPGRYIGGVDTVDDDYGTSLFSIAIMDLFTDKEVAWWIGRFRKAEDNYNQAIKLAVFYGALLNYENKLKGFYAYLLGKNLVHYLCDTPEILQDYDYSSKKETYGNKKKGTPPTAQINKWGRTLQADWMLNKNPITEDFNYKEIRDIGYIRECISWHIDGNFDRVSSRIMLFILREDKRKSIVGMDGKQQEDYDYNKDKFFTEDGEFSTEEFSNINF